jgi:precorrin-8X/cobalt-precorrin-8 methylmutase
MIHATVDFDLIYDTAFHPDAVAKGIAALREGACILTDTKMVKVGISMKRLRKFKTRVLCAISQPEVVRQSRLTGVTRAAVAMQKMVPFMGGSIVAIGNAPTALREVLKLSRKRSHRPSLIVGVPVGLVGAKESKEMLMKTKIPYIAVRGERGGSPLAVSIVNALALLALESEHE